MALELINNQVISVLEAEKDNFFHAATTNLNDAEMMLKSVWTSHVQMIRASIQEYNW